jgi:acetyl esterase/lipase
LESYEAFAAAWDSLRSMDEAALESLLAAADINAPFPAMERARIHSVWAHGHLAYPVLHWRDGDAEAIRPTPGTRAAAEALPLNDAALLQLPEFRAAVLALVHEQARAMLREVATYQSGDNRWTRAEYDYAVEHIPDPSVRDFVLHATLATHLDQNGSEGLEPLLARFAEDVSNPALLRDLVVAYADERRYWSGDWAETYKTVEGTTLEAHLERPDDAAPDASLPVFVWLHGGSFDTGAWYQCPFVCGRALGEGMAVIRLEQRPSDRFQTTPADQLADVRDALTWIRRHAERLRLDPERVVLGGFSSGGTLSVMAAILNVSDGVTADAAPDAAVGIAACVAPLEGDGWFRKSIARTDDPERFSPIHQVRSGVPPLLLIHGTADEYCEYAPVPPFATDMAAEGNDVEVKTLKEQPHFFLFRSPSSRAQALEAFVNFLRERGLADSR